MNTKIGDLTAADFPGIDEPKFNEWRALKIKKSRERRIVFYISRPRAAFEVQKAHRDLDPPVG